VIALFVVPLLAPFAAGWLAPRVVDRCDPVAALWALTVTTGLLALGTVGSLGALLLPGALRLPLLAKLGRLVHPLHAGPPALLYPATLLSLAALVTCAWRLCRAIVRQLRLLRSARARADGSSTVGDLSVVDEDRADAYALPGRPARIVVTRGMLRALAPSEREALFAHERAHLTARHHWFLVTAALSVHCHPGLRPVRTAIELAAERAADEAAASATGDRRTTARAIGRAALAARGEPYQPLAFAPSAVAGPVPRRVAALLCTPVERRPLTPVITLLLLVCTAVPGAAALTGSVSLHSRVEIAQSEQRAVPAVPAAQQHRPHGDHPEHRQRADHRGTARA
jgi:Zn-dependent protease with chaperone function